MLARIICAVRAAVAPVLRDTTGATAVFFAIALVPMLGAVGLAVDSSLGYLLKSRLSKSLDTAGLAAGRVALNDDAAEVARRYFDANFGAETGSITMTEFSYELDPTRQFVTLTAEATAPTVFMRLFGHDTVTVSARTKIERRITGLELALVMDNTGSMWGDPFNAMQRAAFDLVDIVYGGEEEIENLWISLVPYTATVNIGPGRTGWLVAGDPARAGSYPAPGWWGCVRARPTRDETDDPPSIMAFSSFLYPSTAKVLVDGEWKDLDNHWPPLKLALADRNDGRGPNLGCGPAITPLTKSRATIRAGIANMGPWHRGGTAGNLGLSWGWRTISPRWRGLWGGETPATHPLDYGTPLMEKVVVILTDGNNQFYDHDKAHAPLSDFTAYGRVEELAVSLNQGRQRLDARMARTCAAMKAAGITIYTITFGSGGGGPDKTAQTLFRNCASKPSLYYHAPSNADLAGVFKAIGGELANLRIVE